MTDDETMSMGEFCLSLLASDDWNRLVHEFEKTVCHDLLMTKPSQKAEREEIYATFQGLNTFLGYAQQFVAARDKIIAENSPNEEDNVY